MAVECPYSETILKMAFLGLDKKLVDVNIGKRINSRLSEFLIEDKSEMNKRIAEDNGITLRDLINSPNYTTLKKEFLDALVYKAIDILKEEEFTDEEAWAFAAIGVGILKI